jgi:folate-binding protein YgfZ
MRNCQVSHRSHAAAEYEAVRRAVGFLDRSDLGLLEVTGRDRAAFLHAMLSNDVKGLQPGQGCAAAFLDVHGKVQALLLVWALDDRILVLTPPGRAARTLEDFDRYLFSEKAYFRDATGERAFLLLAGPAAPALAERLTGTAVPERPWSGVATRLEGVDVRLVRGGGETGEPEVWIDAPAAEAARARAALEGAGAVRVGSEAWESLRIEAGTPRFGQDVDETVLLPEIPFAHLVSYTKGCYIGQEVVVRIRDRGHVNRHLRGLLLEGDAVPAARAPVTAGDQPAGHVTSAAWSFGLGRPAALALIRRQHAEPGTRLGVQAGDRAVAATVAALPFAR